MCSKKRTTEASTVQYTSRCGNRFNAMWSHLHLLLRLCFSTIAHSHLLLPFVSATTTFPRPKQKLLHLHLFLLTSLLQPLHHRELLTSPDPGALLSPSPPPSSSLLHRNPPRRREIKTTSQSSSLLLCLHSSILSSAPCDVSATCVSLCFKSLETPLLFSASLLRIQSHSSSPPRFDPSFPFESRVLWLRFTVAPPPSPPFTTAEASTFAVCFFCSNIRRKALSHAGNQDPDEDTSIRVFGLVQSCAATCQTETNINFGSAGLNQNWD